MESACPRVYGGDNQLVRNQMRLQSMTIAYRTVNEESYALHGTYHL